MVLWKGRFSKELNHEVNAFNSSLSFDHRMYKQDIRGSLAHAKMLCKQSIIEEKDYEEIVEGLNAILKEIEEGTLLFDPEAEDIHMFVESELTKRYPVAGKKLHTGRSRNDQVALDLRLYAHDEILEIKKMLVNLIHTLTGLAEHNLDTIMPGAAAYDFGDSIRFGASTGAEDEVDLSKIEMSLELFEVFASGYLSVAKEFLTDEELYSLSIGAKIMTLECGIRFLTDYLSGDTYFKIHRPNHNLDRCRTQFKLVADMEKKMDQMHAIVNKYAK